MNILFNYTARRSIERTILNGDFTVEGETKDGNLDINTTTVTTWRLTRGKGVRGEGKGKG